MHSLRCKAVIEIVLILTVILQVLIESAKCQALQATEASSHDSLGQQSLKLVQNACPPWKYDKYHNSSCICGSDLGGIIDCKADTATVYLLTCYCMSYSDQDNKLQLVGTCPYFCTDYVDNEIANATDIDDLCNSEMQQYRHGQMCGKCKDNFSPSPYTYTFECANCSNYKHNWAKYLLIAYLPPTILYVVVIAFRFNAMSPAVNSLIFVCQCAAAPAVMILLMIFVQVSQKNVLHPDQQSVLNIKLLSSLFGMTNLDFFRALYKPFCLRPNMSIVQVLSLDYGIAVYPLFLVCFTYIVVKIHDRSEGVQILLKPALWLFTRINKHSNTAKYSLIEVFGTFLLLSYVKILNTSFNILMPVTLYNVKGNAVGFYLYYNGSMEYFGKDHLPYGILAIFMFATFNLVPLLLLCLYPCRCFQSCLNCCRLNSQVLRTFMDAFQGCYKFEPYDCRYWAGCYLFLRIGFYCVIATTRSNYALLVGGIVVIPCVALTAAVQPYKQNFYNIIDVIMLLAVVQMCVGGIGIIGNTNQFATFCSVMIGIAAVFPFIYAVALVLKNVTPQRLVTAVKTHCQKCMQQFQSNDRSVGSDKNEQRRRLREKAPLLIQEIECNSEEGYI